MVDALFCMHIAVCGGRVVSLRMAIPPRASLHLLLLLLLLPSLLLWMFVSGYTFWSLLYQGSAHPSRPFYACDWWPALAITQWRGCLEVRLIVLISIPG